MIQTVLAKIFGTRNERELKRMMPRIADVNVLEPQMAALTDEQLQEKTVEFRARVIAALEDIPEENVEERVAVEKKMLDDLMPEAFAVCREAAKRVLNMRHFDVQLIGGMALHEVVITEIKTGELK